MAGGARRKIKRLKRTQAEGSDALEKMMDTCRRYGLNIQFTWQLPDVLERALAANGPPSGRAPTSPKVLSGQIFSSGAMTQHRSPADAMRMLATGGLRQVPTIPQQIHGNILTPESADLIEEDDGVDPSLVQGLFEEFGEEEAEEETEAPDLQAMMSQHEAAQARLLGRVATQGVQYGKGMPGPAAGKKLAPHPSTPKKILGAGRTGVPARQAPADPVDEAFPDLQTDFGASFDVDDGGTAPSGDDGRINPKTGMTISQQRALMSKVLGREVKPPGAPGTGLKPGEAVPPTALAGPSALRK